MVKIEQTFSTNSNFTLQGFVSHVIFLLAILVNTETYALQKKMVCALSAQTILPILRLQRVAYLLTATTVSGSVFLVSLLTKGGVCHVPVILMDPFVLVVVNFGMDFAFHL
jgi:hypothetical protein